MCQKARRCQSNISIVELIEINRTQSNYWCSIAEHNRTSIEHEKFGKFRLCSIAFDCSESEHNRTITSIKRISIVFDRVRPLFFFTHKIEASPHLKKNDFYFM